MSGPSLRKKQAHQAIHEGGLSGAIEKTEQLKHAIETKDEARIHGSILGLIDYWETRILSHADAEEAEGGLYYELAGKEPERKEDIIKLTRDHDLLRVLVKQIKEEIEKDYSSGKILQKFEALMIVNEIHSRDEERFLSD